MIPALGLLCLLPALSLSASATSSTDTLAGVTADPALPVSTEAAHPEPAAPPVTVEAVPAASTDTPRAAVTEPSAAASTGTELSVSSGVLLAISTDTPRPEVLEAAPRTSTGNMHLAFFRRPQVTLAMPLLEPLERLLREGEFVFADVDIQVGHSRGTEYLYRTAADPSGSGPLEAPGAPTVRDASVLSTAGGYLLLPADQDAAARMGSAARDPSSYREGRVPRLAVRRAQVTETPMLDGSVIHSVKFLDGKDGGGGWQNALVRIYHLRRGLQEVEAVFLYKTLGGGGRVAWLMDDFHRRYGDGLFVLSRGELFSYAPGASTGTLAGLEAERLGVDVAALGAGELGRLRDVLAYGASRGAAGVAFLSANLVFSTQTARTLLPASRLWDVGGRTIAVFGLTDPESARFVEPGMASQLSLTDPIAAAAVLVPVLRRQAQVVVALTNLPASDNALLKRRVKGIDLIVGDSFPFETETALPTVTVIDPERGPSDEALLVAADGTAIVAHLELELHPLPEGRNSLAVKEEHLLLDESVPEAPDRAGMGVENFGVSSDTRPAIIPAARRLYAGTQSSTAVRLRRRDFWTLAAAMGRAAAGAEAAFVPVFEVYDDNALGDYREDTVRQWFQLEDDLEVFEISGGDLAELVAEVRRQERGGDVAKGGLAAAAAGFGEGDTLHGVSILPNAVYRVAATDRLLARTGQFPALARAARVRKVGALRELVVAGLRRNAEAGLSVEQYRRLLSGRPLEEDAFWLVNFRDISIKATNTKVVSDPAFDNVSNARVRGFDEQQVGGAAKVDAERYRGKFKWTNILELEYSRSRLSPPGQAAILNIPVNRSSLLTLGTRKTGEFPWKWMAQSFGPSLGAQYEGDIERLPGMRRKHVVSVYPGAELFNGSWIQSLGLAANLRRDYTPPSPLNAYGVRLRAVASHTVRAGLFQSELLTNYFIRTRRDTTQDLRLELDAVAKLQIPLWKRLTLIPFVDFYYFVLKVRPISGYSAITGVSLGFNRLWKPQFESF